MKYKNLTIQQKRQLAFTLLKDKDNVFGSLSNINSKFEFTKKKKKGESKRKNKNIREQIRLEDDVENDFNDEDEYNAYIITIVNKHRDAKELSTWLKRYPRADIDYIYNDKTPLMFACINGDIEIVKLLLKAGADTNILYRRESVLTWSAYYGHFEIVKLLLPYIKKNVAYHIIDATHRSSDFGHHQIVMYLVEKHPSIFSLKKIYFIIENMLSIGDIKGNIQNVLTLIQKYKINIEHAHYKLIIDILKQKSNNNNNDIKINQTRSGMSALLYFMMKNKEPVVKLLLEQPGIDVNILFRSETPLLFAYTTRFNISSNIIKLLLQHKDTKVNFQDSYGLSALHYQSNKEESYINKEKLILLLQHGADMFLENDIHETPIELITRKWGMSGLKIFIDHIIRSDNPQRILKRCVTTQTNTIPIVTSILPVLLWVVKDKLPENDFSYWKNTNKVYNFFKWVMDYMITHNQVDLFSKIVLQTEIPFIEGKTGHIGSKNILYYLVIKNYPNLVDQILKKTGIDINNLSYYHNRYRLSSLFWISYTMDRHKKIPQDYRMLNVLKRNVDGLIGSTRYKRMLTFELSKAYPSIKMINFLLKNKANPNKIIESKRDDSDSDSDDTSDLDEKLSTTTTYSPLLVSLNTKKKTETYKKKINIVIDLLFQYGAIIHKDDSTHTSALHLAAQYHNKEILLKIIDNINDMKSMINLVKNQHTPLSEALHSRNFENCKILLQYGADPKLAFDIILNKYYLKMSIDEYKHTNKNFKKRWRKFYKEKITFLFDKCNHKTLYHYLDKSTLIEYKNLNIDLMEMIKSINQSRDMPDEFKDIFNSAKEYVKCTFNSTYNKKGLERVHLQMKEQIDNLISKLLTKLHNDEDSYGYLITDRRTYERMEEKKYGVYIEKINTDFKTTRKKDLKELCFWLFCKKFFKQAQIIRPHTPKTQNALDIVANLGYFGFNK